MSPNHSTTPCRIPKIASQTSRRRSRRALGIRPLAPNHEQARPEEHREPRDALVLEQHVGQRPGPHPTLGYRQRTVKWVYHGDERGCEIGRIHREDADKSEPAYHVE